MIADLDLISRSQALPALKGCTDLINKCPIILLMRVNVKVPKFEQPHISAIHRSQNELCCGMVRRDQVEIARQHGHLKALPSHRTHRLHQCHADIIGIDRMAGTDAEVVSVKAMLMGEADQPRHIQILQHFGEHHESHRVTSRRSGLTQKRNQAIIRRRSQDTARRGGSPEKKRAMSSAIASTWRNRASTVYPAT